MPPHNHPTLCVCTPTARCRRWRRCQQCTASHSAESRPGAVRPCARTPQEHCVVASAPLRPRLPGRQHAVSMPHHAHHAPMRHQHSRHQLQLWKRQQPQVPLLSHAQHDGEHPSQPAQSHRVRLACRRPARLGQPPPQIGDARHAQRAARWEEPAMLLSHHTESAHVRVQSGRLEVLAPEHTPTRQLLLVKAHRQAHQLAKVGKRMARRHVTFASVVI